MRRIAVIVGLATILAASPALAAEITLKSGVTVEDSYVRLGDLFANVGTKSSVKIAYAPAPGKSSVFNA